MKTQIWIAVSVYVLVAIIKKGTPRFSTNQAVACSGMAVRTGSGTL